MKFQADKKRLPITITEGEWVLVRLQPYRHKIVAIRMHHKLCQKYYGPYEIYKKISDATYILQLPIESKIDPTFHVSRLKKFYGPISEPETPATPLIAIENQPISYPLAILDHQTVLKGRESNLV